MGHHDMEQGYLYPWVEFCLSKATKTSVFPGFHQRKVVLEEQTPRAES